MIREVLLPLVRNVADIQTISNSEVLLTSRITNIEQIVSTFLPRWPHSQKWNRISALSQHACGRLKQMLPLRVAFLASPFPLFDMLAGGTHVPSGGHRLHQEDSFNLIIRCRRKMQMVIVLKTLILPSTFSLETRCSSTTRSAAHMCPNSRWRSSVHYLEYERACWIPCLLTTLQGNEAHLSYTTCQE